ncbi:MAG TPA: DUF2304 domain-containing protein [Candidatus Magasanikbacteria bacterium]|nr:DUF2304 domain-containing protein [Candidatus Magasanikbacteria bacterium]
MFIQIILIIFIIFALSRVVIRAQKKEIRIGESLGWVVFWLLAGAAVLWPGGTVVLANTLGVGRGSDLIFYVSLALLFYMMFRIFVRLERLERNITKVVRDRALKDGPK